MSAVYTEKVGKNTFRLTKFEDYTERNGKIVGKIEVCVFKINI